MRFPTTLAFIALGSVSFGQEAPLFSPEDRDQVMRFWSAPGRYTIALPLDVSSRGAWQVRQTVAGSQWFWNLSRGRKGPGDISSLGVSAATEEWIKARLNRDRWEALREAQEKNAKQLGVAVPLADDSYPFGEPPQPGPVPKALLDTVGAPPKLAEACIPMEYRVMFDDVTLTYQDRRKLGSPRNAFYRFDQGVGDAGLQVKNLPAERLTALFAAAGINETEAKIMRSVSLLEGGFDAVNTYDTGFVSIGFIQFACLKEGGGSLGGMLRQYKVENPVQFAADFHRFGLDVTEDGKLVALNLVNGEESVGAAAASQIIEDKRLVAVFQRAGRMSDPFIAAQIKAAKSMYLPVEDGVTLTVDGKTLTGKVSDLVKSEAGLAILMDRKVNTGKLGPFLDVVAELALQFKVQTLAELAPFERMIIERCRFRKDYLLDSSLTQPLAVPARAVDTASRGGNTRSGRGGGNPSP